MSTTQSSRASENDCRLSGRARSDQQVVSIGDECGRNSDVVVRARSRRSPRASSPEALRRMLRQRRRDTQPELAIRRLLHADGMRYRVDSPPIPGLRRRADVVFPRLRIAVFVDGCFWHRCPEHGTCPRENAPWWQAKLDGNVDRDLDTDRQLRDAGWKVVRIWEHENSRTAADRVEQVVGLVRGVNQRSLD